MAHDKVNKCRSRHFDCLLQVFFRRWGRLVPVQHYVSWWPAAIGAFRSGYCFRVLWFPRAFANLPCIVGFDVYLFVGIHASGISASLSLFMLFGLSLASHFPCVPMVLSVNKLYFVPQRLVSGPLACSETAEF